MYILLIFVLCALLPSSLTQRLTDLFPQGGLCALSTEERVSTLRELESNIRTIPECGSGLWRRVASLDVTGDDTTCPGDWRFVTSLNRPGCTKPNNNVGGCSLATFSTGPSKYSKVCGRIAGRATGTPNGLAGIIDEDGVLFPEGIVISVASPFEHIWTLTAAFDSVSGLPCPCDDTFTGTLNEDALNFVQDNYFCDFAPRSGNRQLWTANCDDISADEEDGRATACCMFGGPPYFSMTLAVPTSADIDARICTDTSGESIRAESLEFFVQ